MENSRIQWQEIGEKVHLTGQAVRNRIVKLERNKVIKGYTINIDSKVLGNNVTAYITIFMKTTNHEDFKSFIKENLIISEASRISGDGCYLLKVNTKSENELVELLDNILKYGNYKVNLSIENIK
jgi:Transcriptional regulators